MSELLLLSIIPKRFKRCLNCILACSDVTNVWTTCILLKFWMKLSPPVPHQWHCHFCCCIFFCSGLGFITYAPQSTAQLAAIFSSLPVEIIQPPHNANKTMSFLFWQLSRAHIWIWMFDIQRRSQRCIVLSSFRFRTTATTSKKDNWNETKEKIWYTKQKRLRKKPICIYMSTVDGCDWMQTWTTKKRSYLNYGYIHIFSMCHSTSPRYLLILRISLFAHR